LKKVMLLGAVVAMMLAAAVPALAQTVTQIGDNNIACVQTAVQQNIVSQGNGNAQANQYGDNIIANSNINAQAIAQECNITVEQVNTVAKKGLTFNKAGEVVVVKKTATATASASASAPAKVQYKAAKTVTASASAPAKVQYKAAKTVTASASAAAPTQYQYKAAAAQYQYASASAAPAAELPSTGGSSLIALGAGVLLVAGGLLARRIVR
jgi:LPXTG-motif cell wall-anchored protein